MTLANLRPATRYDWLVVAKGDPFCAPVSTRTSASRSFVTAEGCSEPAPFATRLPADGSSGAPSTVSLEWESREGAVYDLYFGTSSPPPLLASNLTQSSRVVSGLVGATYVWKVVAHAACDPARTSSTPESRFTVAAACGGAGAFDLVSPPSAATGVGVDVVLSWAASAGATGYDLYLGRGANPPLFRSGLAGTSTLVTGLDPGVSWSWKVVANACAAGGARASALSTFTTAAACPSPEPTSFVFAPPGSVAAGTTYVLTWSEAKGLDPDGGYLIERSRDAQFGGGVEVQSTSATSASFLASEPGTYHHRVRPVASCNPAAPGAFSAVRAVSAVRDAPNVVFSTLPNATITNLGEPLEEKRTAIAIENLGAETVQVVVGRNELASVPFFTIVDPAGGDAFLTLPPRTPKVLEIRFSGPANDAAGSYQGIVFAASLGEGLRVTPYAFVNLKIGGRSGAAPQFVSGGAPVEYAAFPGWDGEDATRPPLEIEIRNPGSEPMELAAEIGPEIWLRPEPGWNATPIPAGATRRVKLFTQRVRAPNGLRAAAVHLLHGAHAGWRVRADSRSGRFGAARVRGAPAARTAGEVAHRSAAVERDDGGRGSARFDRAAEQRGKRSDPARPRRDTGRGRRIRSRGDPRTIGDRSTERRGRSDRSAAADLRSLRGPLPRSSKCAQPADGSERST